jgi:hypothetical protein
VLPRINIRDINGNYIYFGTAVRQALASPECRNLKDLLKINDEFHETGSRIRPDRQWTDEAYAHNNYVILIRSVWQRLPKTLLPVAQQPHPGNVLDPRNYTAESRNLAQGTRRVISSAFVLARSLAANDFQFHVGVQDDQRPIVQAMNRLIVALTQDIRVQNLFVGGSSLRKIGQILTSFATYLEAFNDFPAGLGPYTFSLAPEYEQTVGIPLADHRRRTFYRERLVEGHDFDVNPVTIWCGPVRSGRLMPMLPDFDTYDRGTRNLIFECFGLDVIDENELPDTQ